MVALKKTNEVQEDSNLYTNYARILIARRKVAQGYGSSWNAYDAVHWSDYQIKESDMRAKTATFTSNTYLDLTTGVYTVLITSKYHEDFAGVILSVDYDEGTGLYEYQCQDWSRDYQSKFSLVATNITRYRILKYLVTRGATPLTGTISKKVANNLKVPLSGLKYRYQYEQKYWGVSAKNNFNPMTDKLKVIIKNKSWIEAIRDLAFGSGAYVDVYFDKNGVCHVEPYHKKDWKNTGLHLLPQQIASRKFSFDTTNVITGAVVDSTSKTKAGKYYGSKSLINLDLTSFFGNITDMISNPNQQTTTTAKTSTAKTSAKKSTTTNNTKNPYGTKKKVVWLNSDNIYGKTADKKFLNDIAKILKKNGWKTKVITPIGPSAHYTKRGKVKNGIWFTVYGGVCAGTLRETANNSWFRKPLVKNGSRTVVGFRGACDIRKGGKCYKKVGRAHDDNFSSKNPTIKYPANYLTKYAIPFMYASTAAKMAAKFLAGGDNKSACTKNWKFNTK
jgi:hypothetical protein